MRDIIERAQLAELFDEAADDGGEALVINGFLVLSGVHKLLDEVRDRDGVEGRQNRLGFGLVLRIGRLRAAGVRWGVVEFVGVDDVVGDVNGPEFLSVLLKDSGAVMFERGLLGRMAHVLEETTHIAAVSGQPVRAVRVATAILHVADAGFDADAVPENRPVDGADVALFDIVREGDEEVVQVVLYFDVAERVRFADFLRDNDDATAIE
jgi:hypothetical protein